MNKSVFKKYRIPFIIITVILGFLIGVAFYGYIFLSNFIPNPDVNTNINKYQKYIGENAKKEYKNKWGMDESIFPQSITDDMSVEDYKMVYDNPFGDAEYLSCLVIKYDEDTYKNEVKRLETYKSDEYIGIYGAEGFDSKYKLLAMNADSYYGFVYALTNQKDTIVYVEIIFCGFVDFDYKDYIKEEYLPIGFNAQNGNPYMFGNKTKEVGSN